MRILLDANFLIYCAKQKIDYVSEMLGFGEVVVLSAVVREVEKLKDKAEKSKDKEAASVSFQILEKNIKDRKIKVLKTSDIGGDEAIIAEIKEGDLVATMDAGLKKKLKGKTRILSIKGRKKLEIL